MLDRERRVFCLLLRPRLLPEAPGRSPSALSSGAGPGLTTKRAKQKAGLFACLGLRPAAVHAGAELHRAGLAQMWARCGLLTSSPWARLGIGEESHSGGANA